MNENFKRTIDTEKQNSDREVRQVTHRNFESYLNLFNLPEDSLAKIETVVDVGAGFSSFSEEARKNYSGLRAIAVDPIYKLIKADPDLTSEQLQKQERVHLDFDPSYRCEEETGDFESYPDKEAEIYRHFVGELRKHPTEYVTASHQDLPLEDCSAGLILASNSIIRRENSPQIISRALQECIRIMKESGEIRIAGNIACFQFNQTTGNIELWYNGTLSPGGSWVKELEETGHYSDPQLMKVLVNLEETGVNFYCVIVSQEQDGETHSRFDTMILRKDKEKPKLQVSESEKVKMELRKLQFQATDGFNVPSSIEQTAVAV